MSHPTACARTFKARKSGDLHGQNEGNTVGSCDQRSMDEKKSTRSAINVRGHPSYVACPWGVAGAVIEQRPYKVQNQRPAARLIEKEWPDRVRAGDTRPRSLRCWARDAQAEIGLEVRLGPNGRLAVQPLRRGDQEIQRPPAWRCTYGA